jgi:hypothetical protein
MSFLAPLFLMGALAVGLPILFHLIRRTTRERKQFSSLMFLLSSPPRLTRRSRLEHLLLLALRCLALCLIALGFARPFIKDAIVPESSSGAPRRIVVLVDTSASMRRANLWADARARVEDYLRQTSPVDQAAIFAFDRRLRPLVSFDAWNAAPAGDRVALAARTLAETAPGWSSTHLGNALIAAAEALAETPGRTVAGPRQVLLVSDLQEGSRLDQLQGYEWPKGIELSVEVLKPRNISNASLQLVTDSDEAKPDAMAGVRVRVSNSAESRHEKFRVGWASADGRAFTGEASEVYVPPGQSRVVALPLGRLPAGSQPASRVLLQGDDEDFDNSVFVIPPEALRLNILYFGADSEKDSRQPRYFLQRAFQETRRQAVQVVSPSAASLPAEVQAAGLLVVADALPENQARLLHDEVAAGQTLLFMLKDAAAGATLGRIIGIDRVAVEEGRVGNYAMLAEIDFRHPLFSGFADPRFSDFTKIHFWKYRKVEAAALPGARVLAAFDNGDPALLEIPIGKGHAFVLTSGWQPEDSQLALSTKFVPLMYALLEQTGRSAPAPTQYHVDDVIPISSLAGRKLLPVGVVEPDGSRVNLSGVETNFTQTAAPGIYKLDFGGETRQFAVNLEGAESRTTPLPVDELERLGAPMRGRPSEAVVATRKVRLLNTELEARQKLWRWVLVATLALLVFETWLSGRTARSLAIQPKL